MYRGVLENFGPNYLQDEGTAPIVTIERTKSGSQFGTPDLICLRENLIFSSYSE